MTLAMRDRLAFACLLLAASAPGTAFGQKADDYNQAEFTARPSPEWVEIFDQGQLDPRLKGIETPRGIKVEIVAEEPAVLNPLGIAFADDGTLHVLEWKPGASNVETEDAELPDGTRVKFHRTHKDSKDVLKTLHDQDGDGIYDEARVLMDDLELPSGLLLHEGWIYWTSAGQVLRRRPHEVELLKTLQEAANDEKGPPTASTSDGKWIEQQLIRGLSAVVPFQASGLTIGIDGWLYVTTGSGDNRAESWDGSRAAVLHSGAVFRMRPNGSQVREFARGLRNSFGGVAFDELGNAFHLVDDLEGGGKFEGVRLLHVLEGADYGWRHRGQLIGREFDAQVLSQPDLARAAAWGERLGTLPGILKTGRGSPAGLMIYQGTQLPHFFLGLVIYPDPDRKLVRAYAVERAGDTFAVTAQFDLLRSGDPLFRPCAAVQGPDGAIYIGDWRTDANSLDRLAGDGQHGRIYRLSWSGSSDVPAIPLASTDTWMQIATVGEDVLTSLLSQEDFELRRRAAIELVRRARLDERLAPAIAARVTTIAYDDSRPAPVRAAALSAAAQLMDKTAFEALLATLGGDEPNIQRLSADALGDHPLKAEEDRERLRESLRQHLLQPQPGVPRSMLLAHGKIAGTLEHAEWAYEATSVSHAWNMSPQVFDAHVRALEMTPGAPRDLLLGNLDVAINFADGEAKERERIKRFVVVTAESMRTRELALFLDALLRGEEDLLGRLDPPLQARLIATYRNVQVEPPIMADAVAEWLAKHPGTPADVDIAALETMSLVGTTKPESVTNLADRLLAQPDQAKEIARRYVVGRLGRQLQSRITEALRKHAKDDQTGEFSALLQSMLKNTPE